jgi:hypothetical protein
MGGASSRPGRPESLNAEQWAALLDEEEPQWRGPNRLRPADTPQQRQECKEQQGTVDAVFKLGDQLRLMMNIRCFVARHGMRYVAYYVTNACVGPDCDPVVVDLPDGERCEFHRRSTGDGTSQVITVECKIGHGDAVGVLSLRWEPETATLHATFNSASPERAIDLSGLSAEDLNRRLVLLWRHVAGTTTTWRQAQPLPRGWEGVSIAFEPGALSAENRTPAGRVLISCVASMGSCSTVRRSRTRTEGRRWN